MRARAGLFSILFLAAVCSPAAAQTLVYSVVTPPPITSSNGLYTLQPLPRLYTIDSSSGQATSITLPAGSCVFAVQPDATSLYYACGDKSLTVADALGRKVATIQLSDVPTAMAVSPDGTKLVVGTATALQVFSAPSLSGIGSVPFASAKSIVVGADNATGYAAANGKLAAVALSPTRLTTQLTLPSFVTAEVAGSPDGSVVVVTQEHNLYVLDTSTITLSAPIVAPNGIQWIPSLDASGAHAYLPLSSASGLAVVDLTSRQISATYSADRADVQTAVLTDGRVATMELQSTSTVFRSVDPATGSQLTVATVPGSASQLTAAPSSAQMLPSTEGCTIQFGRLTRTLMASLEPNPQDPRGSTLTMGVNANPDSCAWSAQIDVPWLTMTPSSGTGPTIATLVIAANTSGVIRTGHVTVGSVTYTVTQAACVQPIIFFDSPKSNTSVTQPVSLHGWALDPCAVSGTGLTAYGGFVGSSTTAVALHYGAPRPDVAAAYGAQFLNSGFNSDPFPERAPGPVDFSATFLDASLPFIGQAVTGTVTNVNVLPSAAPFGFVDTPQDGTIAAGELAVTGWALDDVKLAGIAVYRNAIAGETGDATGRIFLGNAIRIPGARPDVQALFPTVPESDNAGWGLMVLTNFLPNGGNGTFVLSADASDLIGHVTTLGSKVIAANNSASVAPFGTIDTPAQGATVSGSTINFGWALAQKSTSIPIDGSTIDVLIDGVSVGHPVYNNFRSDIAALFPGYANTDGAVGYFVLDTTTLSNGLHTIAWRVRDAAGNVSVIGSRFFTVANP